MLSASRVDADGKPQPAAPHFSHPGGGRRSEFRYDGPNSGEACALGPLDGIRVVELSTGIAGPVAGMLLGDYGAEVVKVEPPSGDPARALAGFAVWNRNKQSVGVDPRSPGGRRRLAALLADADLCIYADAASIDGAVTNPGLVRLHM